MTQLPTGREFFGMVLGAFLILFVASLCFGCAQQGAAPRLQARITQTAGHIQDTRNRVELIDYKSGRALRLIDEGFAK